MSESPMAPATRKNVAEEKSAGTATSCPRKDCPPNNLKWVKSSEAGQRIPWRLSHTFVISM